MIFYLLPIPFMALALYFFLKKKKADTEILLLKEKLSFQKESHEKMSETFQALSSLALQRNNQQFLDLAKATLEKYQEGAKGDLEKKKESIDALLTPMKETLSKLDQGMRQVEKERKGEHEALREHLKMLAHSEKELKKETEALSKALRAPTVRGRWGEMQLRRVVELAGMVKHCDFNEQAHESNDDGAVRPDLLVHLPGDRRVVVDAKAPLEAYMEAMHAQDDKTRELKMAEHARHVRSHIVTLGKKSYWESFKPSPEFVVLFLPSETFFSAALESDPTLVEMGVDLGVILATPTTLIALLRSVAYGWKQESLSKHVEEVSQLGHDLYKRLCDMNGHFSKMGRSLTSAIDSYNRTVGSLESRVFPTARKFKELGAASSKHELTSPEMLEKIPRIVQDS